MNPSMRKIFWGLSIFAVVMALGVLAFLAGQALANLDEPPLPPYVDPVTFEVDLDRLPDRLPVADRNG